MHAPPVPPPPPAAATARRPLPPIARRHAEPSLQQEAWRRPLSSHTLDAASSSSSAAAGATAATLQPPPPIVALGKFDALHRGHRELAAAAARLGGAPWLVSFSGIAEVLGWPARLPLVAPCDRARVLATWAPHCGGATPRECSIPFAEVGCYFVNVELLLNSFRMVLPDTLHS